MRRALITSSLVLCQGLLACAGTAVPQRCEPGTTSPCQCGGGSLSGLTTCGSDGSAFGACDCGLAACAPMASQRCQGDHLFDVDACGNLDPLSARRCACPCAPGGTACPAWQEPAALRPAPACTVVTSCLVVEDLHCAPVGAEWLHGERATNGCGFAVRCYVYNRTSWIQAIPGGSIESTDTFYAGPPTIPQLPPGPALLGGFTYSSEAACRATWDARSVSELGYFACVRADDSPSACLPALADPLTVLAPTCSPGG